MWMPAKMCKSTFLASIYWKVTCWSGPNNANLVSNFWCRGYGRLVEISCEVITDFATDLWLFRQMFALTLQRGEDFEEMVHKPFWMVNLALLVLPKSPDERDTSWSREPIWRGAPYPMQWLSQLDLAKRDKDSREEGKGQTVGGKYFEACSEEVVMYLLTRQRWTLHNHPQNVNSPLSVMFSDCKLACNPFPA